MLSENWKILLDYKSEGNVLLFWDYSCFTLTTSASTSKLYASIQWENQNRCFGRQGPVVRRLISANLGLNFNLSFFFFCLKTFPRIGFAILFSVSNHQIVDEKNKTEFVFLSFYIWV